MNKENQIGNDSISRDARLFINRENVLAAFPKINSYLEIGVLAGDYSDLVINTLSPQKISLLDLFNSEDEDQGIRFTSSTHLDFIKNKYSDKADTIEIIAGNSHQKLLDMVSEGRVYDYIYIDANHQVPGVYGDLLLASSLISKNGIIGLNDFVMFFWSIGKPCGTIDAVSHFLKNFKNWEIFAYSLNSSEGYYGDIYLRKKF